MGIYNDDEMLLMSNTPDFSQVNGEGDSAATTVVCDPSLKYNTATCFQDQITVALLEQLESESRAPDREDKIANFSIKNSGT